MPLAVRDEDAVPWAEESLDRDHPVGEVMMRFFHSPSSKNSKLPFWMRALSGSVYVCSVSSVLESVPPPQAVSVPAAASMNEDNSRARIFLFLRFL